MPEDQLTYLDSEKIEKLLRKSFMIDYRYTTLAFLFTHKTLLNQYGPTEMFISSLQLYTYYNREHFDLICDKIN